MIRSYIVFLLLLISSFSAAPCSIRGLEHEIEFESQSAALGTKNALALVEWFIKWRDGVGVGDISISAYSVENDRRSLAVSHERMNNIAKIINKLNKNNVPVKFRDRAPVPARGPFAFLSNRAVVAVQPACLKTNTCCSQPITQQDSP